MSRDKRVPPLGWLELAGLGLFGVVFLLGLAANNPEPMRFGIAVGFVATLVLVAWMCCRGLEQSRVPRPKLTRGQRAWQAGVFVAWLAAMGGIGWFWYAGVFDEKNNGAEPQGQRREPGGPR